MMAGMSFLALPIGARPVDVWALKGQGLELVSDPQRNAAKLDKMRVDS